MGYRVEPEEVVAILVGARARVTLAFAPGLDLIPDPPPWRLFSAMKAAAVATLGQGCYSDLRYLVALQVLDAACGPVQASAQCASLNIQRRDTDPDTKPAHAVKALDNAIAQTEAKVRGWFP